MKNQVQLITYVDRLSAGGLNQLQEMLASGAIDEPLGRLPGCATPEFVIGSPQPVVPTQIAHANPTQTTFLRQSQGAFII